MPTDYRELQYGLATYNIARLARVIKQTNPDLVALQEVDVAVKRSRRIHEAQRLAELTGMAVRFGPTQHYEGGLFGNAVLTRFEILDVQIHPLPYTESTSERTTYPRGAIAVTVRAPDGRALRFVSTHFQHNVPEDRVAEAKAINRLFAKASDRTPTILAGDMNATPDAEPIAILLTNWSVRPTIRLHRRLLRRNRGRESTMFYRPANHFRLLTARVVDEAVASDHRPIFAELELSDHSPTQDQ